MRGVLDDQPQLVAILHQRPHAAAVGRLGRVVPGRDEQEEAHHDLVLLELLAVDLGVDEHACQIVGGLLATLGDHFVAALEDLRDVLAHDRLGAARVEVRVTGAERGVISAAQTASSSGGIPMKLPITRETTGCATSLTRSQRGRDPRADQARR